jgi:hypothetical protein
MATFFDSNGVNLTSFGANRLNKNTVAVTISSDRVEIIGDGVDGEVFTVPSYNVPATQLELGKDASGNYLNGCIKNFYYYPVSLTAQQLKSLSLRRETKQLPPASEPNFVFTVQIPTANITWNLRSTGTVNYDVDWGDGQKEIVQTSNTKAHTYVNPGNYTVVVTPRSGVFRPFFNNTTDAARITSILSTGTNWNFGTNLANAFYNASQMLNMENIYTSNVTDMSNAWRNCRSLLSFPLLDTPSVTTVAQAWINCTSLTSFPAINTASVTNFSFAWQSCSKLISFPLLNTSSGTNFDRTWQLCTNLTSFPLINTSSGTTFVATWTDCSSLTSFPLIDTSSATTFISTWEKCTNLTSFPLINTSNATVITQSWYRCFSLTNFPLIDTSNVTSFQLAWGECTSLTSFPLLDSSNVTNFSTAWVSCFSLSSFPLIDTSSGTTFFRTWENCTSLTTFPANMFNITGTLIATAFSNAFLNCALTAQSIENILTSLVTNGQSNITLTLSGGTNATKTTWTANANTAYDALIARGWTITFRA